MLAQFRQDGIISDTCVLRISITALHCWNTRGYAKALAILLLLRLYLAHPRHIILQAGSDTTSIDAIDVIESAHSYPGDDALTAYEVMLGEAIPAHG